MAYISYSTISISEKKPSLTLSFPAISLCWKKTPNTVPPTVLYQNSTFNQLSLQNFNINYENFSTQRHDCLKINGDMNSNGNILVSNEEGRFYGINLQINSTLRELYIYIGNNSYSPVSSEVENIILKINHDISIAINKVENELLPAPYGTCKNLNGPDDFDSNEYKSVFRSTTAYRQINCLEICALFKVLQECGCTSASACNQMCIFQKYC